MSMAVKLPGSRSSENRTDFYTLEEIEKLPVSTAHLKVLKSYLKAVN